MPFHSLYSPVIHWHDMISMYLLIFFSFTLTAKHFLLSPVTPGEWKKKYQNWGSHFVIFNFVDNAILSRNQIDWNIKRVTPATGEPIHSVACVDMIKVNSGSFPHEHALAHSHSKSTNYFFIFLVFVVVEVLQTQHNINWLKRVKQETLIVALNEFFQSQLMTCVVSIQLCQCETMTVVKNQI